MVLDTGLVFLFIYFQSSFHHIYETQSHFVAVGGADAIVASIAALTTHYNPMVGPCAVHINCGISLISFIKL